MLTIQGLPPALPQHLTAPVAAPRVAPTPPVAKAETLEARQDERQESASGRTEPGEGGQGSVGTRFSATA